MAGHPGVPNGSPSSPPRLASRADCEGLRAWGQAGADLRQPGYDGRSALHVVSAPGALSGTTSSRKPSLTAPPAPPSQMPNPCPPCGGIPYAGTVGWGGGYPFSCPRSPPPPPGSRAVGTRRGGGDTGSSMHRWEPTLVQGCSGPASWSTRLRQPPNTPHRQRQLGTWKWWPSCRTFGVGLVTRPRAQ